VAPDNNSLGALEMGVLPTHLPGGQLLNDSKVRGRLTSFWGAKLSPVAGLDFEGMLAEAGEGRLKAMLVMGADPVGRSLLARAVLDQIPFLVVQDLFLTETASLAHVVLPAASFAETEGSYTNLTGRWQAVQAAKRPPGDARPDWWAVVELAKRMVGEKQQKVWEFSGPHSVLGEIAKILGARSAHFRGLDYASMGPGGRQRPEPKRAVRRSFLRVDPATPSQDPSYPLSLVTGHLLYDRGAFLRCSAQLQSLVPDAFVMIHPEDADSLNLAEGGEVSVVSAQGELSLLLRVSDEIVRGVAYVPLNLGEVSASVLSAAGNTPTHIRITQAQNKRELHTGE
jgi:predicted molibdopterin-dependent oxidoreductase YjgC